jgi:hypothetical protein
VRVAAARWAAMATDVDDVPMRPALHRGHTHRAGRAETQSRPACVTGSFFAFDSRSRGYPSRFQRGCELICARASQLS